MAVTKAELEQLFEGSPLRRAYDIDAAAQDTFEATMDRYNPALRDFVVGFLFRPHATVSGNRIVRGKAQLATSREREMYEADAWVIVGYDEWSDLTEMQRED